MGHRNCAGGVLGRFISRDPIGHAGNLNLYAYPTNPVTYTDSSGLDCYLDLVTVEGGTYHPYNPFGHAFLEVTPIPGTGSQWKARTTYGSTKGDNVTVNRELEPTGAYQDGARRKRLRIRLDNNLERVLLKHIKDRRKNEKWSEANNCGVFSITAWNLVAPDELDINLSDIMEEATLDTGFSEEANTGIRIYRKMFGRNPFFPSPRKLRKIIETLNKER